jgi:Zn-dependent peptidase ImmA (M78 family)
MPETAIRPELRRFDIGKLIELKREWGVSIQALYERAYSLRLATPVSRASFYKALNARGWKTREPGSEMLPIERPELARHIGETLRSKGLSSVDIDRLAGFVVTEENPFQPTPTPLRVVH